jgi:ribosomal protein S18 acetylase RimI-like enzyme
MAEAYTQLRIDAAQLLTNNPVDALTSYFALEHDPKRVKLYLRTAVSGRSLAFVAVCQTGLDLFRPLIVMRGDDSSALRDALKEALSPGRQYLLNAPPALQPDIAAVCSLSGESINAIYTLSALDHTPVVNIMVQTSATPDGMLRASVAARDGSNAAEAGTSWISSRYGEVFVQVAESVRRRGLGKSVVSAVCTQLLQRNRAPLYITRTDNVASRKLAERLGFQDTGAFELSGALALR